LIAVGAGFPLIWGGSWRIWTATGLHIGAIMPLLTFKPAEWMVIPSLTPDQYEKARERAHEQRAVNLARNEAGMVY